MQKVNHPQGKWWGVVLGGIGLLVIIIDQLSKTWIRANLAVGQALFDAGFFRIINVQNTGASFGIFKGYTTALAVISIIGVVAILSLVFILRGRWAVLNRMLTQSAIALVIGGTIGNLIDRLGRGYVTDFIDFKVWPTFNVADAAGVVGVIIIAYCVLRSPQLTKH